MLGAVRKEQFFACAVTKLL